MSVDTALAPATPAAPATGETPVTVHRAIALAQDFEQLQGAAQGLRATVVALQDAQASSAEATAVFSTLADALTRRSIELSISELGPPPCPLSWVTLGSHGRQEAMPGSDMDSALAWEGDEDQDGAVRYMRALGSRVTGVLARCGLSADKRGATAGEDLFVRPVSSWRRIFRESIKDPRSDKGLVVISLFLDGRVLDHRGSALDLQREFAGVRHRRGLLRLMLALALANKPAVGFMRDFVLDRSAEHRGLLDIKRGGLLPVTSIARYASLAAGVSTARSTSERLSAAAAAGTLDCEFSRTLRDDFELFQGLRLEHHVSQIERGTEPDDYLDPAALPRAMRRRLRDALREVRSVQKRLSRQLSGEIAFA